MHSRLLILGVLSALCGVVGGRSAQAQTGITGGLSNFDVPNHCDEPCDEFEVEIEDCRPEDITHTYRNGNYGSPSVTRSAAGTSTIIDYHSPAHLTQVNSVEHYGIGLRQLGATNTIRVRWMRGGRSALVNGQVPNPNGSGASSHASQPMLPLINADMGIGSTGGNGVSCTVTNTDPTQAMWIKRRGIVYLGTVTLEALMPNDPVVTTTVPIDSAPIFLGAGQSLTITSDLIEIEDNQSAVFAAEYFQDIFTFGGLFGTSSHTRGAALGNVMTATLTSPGTGCDQSRPVIQVQPIGVTVAAGHSAALTVSADGNDLTLTYQWLREGSPLAGSSVFHGVTTDELSIDPVSAATEGFYSVRVTNDCGWIVSDSALVYLTGHNVAPARPITGSCCDAAGACTLTLAADCAAGNPWTNATTCTPTPCAGMMVGACCDGTGCVVVDQAGCLGSFRGAGSACGATACCVADFDQSGAATVQDIFGFLNAWFANDPRADVNGVDGLTIQDIFDFLTVWFAGC